MQLDTETQKTYKYAIATPRPVSRMKRRHIPDTDIPRAVGEAGWWRLPKAIRERFKDNPKFNQVRTYKGVMSTVTCSHLGWAFAWLSRLVGSPLTPHTGNNVPVTVNVFKEKERQGIVWDRIYAFNPRRKVTVRSRKVKGVGDALLECVDGGIGMELQVFEKNQALHFVSRQYFWDLFGVRLNLPSFLTPGVAHVVHADKGNGMFQFTITMVHPIFGQMFYQDGLFLDEETGEN